MHATIHGERKLTELDHARLTKLLDEKAHPGLEELLDNTDVVQARDIPPNIVTMYSQVTIEDTRTGQRQKLTLCYPTDAEPASGFISVLSPVGMSLIGLGLGMEAQWPTPSGEKGSARVVDILFQPEASGDYTT